ncbi:uncharacterized protein LOC143028315 [Oratosquilla oratoria]|uniref:uncharacterized protein LOC143028315 n=1 Tax=Oratosquilla oratoria TaxID=337810 RepID=UPI003F76FA06
MQKLTNDQRCSDLDHCTIKSLMLQWFKSLQHWTLAGRGVYGVYVVRLQPDGLATSESQGLYNGELDRNNKIDSFTFCGRIKFFYLHSRATYFRMMDTVENRIHMLKGEVWLDRVRPVISHRWNFQLLKNKLRAFRWYHICFTYDHVAKLISTYLDGELEYYTEYDTKRQVYGDFAEIGQSDHVSKSFSGDISQVNVWDYLLDTKVIKELAECQKDLTGNFINWEAGWILTKATSYDVPLEHFCQRDIGELYFWFPIVPMATAYYLCEALGSHLPLPVSQEEIDTWYALAKKTYPEDAYCKHDFWSSINDRREEGVYVTHYNNEIDKTAFWKDGEPNGLNYENCAKVEFNGHADIDCDTNLRCAVCTLLELKILSLRGTCEKELRNINFVAYQEGMGHLIFKGYGEYQIRMEEGQWTWVDHINNITIAVMHDHEPHYPMGRRTWTLLRDVCDQEAGDRVLLLTPCREDQYSCDNAACIPLEMRCDLKYDCLDRSDEANCQLVTSPVDYKKGLPPRASGEGSATLPILLTVTIESMSLETTLMTMRLSYSFQMTWYDNRIDFYNLKRNVSLNLVPYGTIVDLWSPVIGFVNTDGNQHTQVDVEVSMAIERLSGVLRREQSLPGEVEVFAGEENTLQLTRKYSTVFICDFNLILYPFDDQHCDMHLRILSASKAYLEFDLEHSLAEYLGNSLLVEYEVSQPKLVPDPESDFSELRVRVPLKRRSGYAILNIYTPSFILLIIAFVTLFFRPQIFEVRVMTALTSLLVMATLFTQVSTSLPKTSYFKMVDIWLLFCIAIIFIIIVFHAIIDIKVNEEAFFPSVPVKVNPMTNPDPLFGAVLPEKSQTQKLVLFARSFMLTVFVVFNVIYWGYILS